jgi:ribonuclease BN (tRNA processing enzyme)
MIIRAIGTGNAFSTVNFNTQFLLEEGKGKMLVDCGWTTPLALKHAGVALKDINYFYVSHAHSDHIGGLEYVAFMRYDWVTRPQTAGDFKTCRPPVLIGNQKLIDDLWDHSLRGGLESMEGFEADLQTFFDVEYIYPNKSFEFEGWKCELVQQVHIVTGNVFSHTYGLMMSKPEHKTVYFTTDSQHCSPKQMTTFYKKADIIFQDCECLPLQFMSGVHANYLQLSGAPEANSEKLTDDVKKKMYLVHYQDFVSQNLDGLGNPCDWDLKAATDGFAGFVKLGNMFEV